jgi:type IX secretion system substrate protein
MTAKRTILLFVTGLICVLSLNINAQVDPTVPIPTKSFPMHLLMPKAYTQDPYGIDATTISAGPFDNYMISTNNGFAETDICVNPRNPLNFVATDNRITGFAGTRWIYYTTDGGVNWIPTAFGGSNAGDPAFCADSLGNFYMALLNTSVTSIVVYKSTDGGASWAFTSQTPSVSQLDKEWIAADQTGGPFQNNVYVAFVNFSSGTSVDFYRSTNNGASWTFSGNMGTGSPNPGPDIATGPNGVVYLAWYNSTGTAVRKSTDGGATFSALTVASNHTTPGAFSTVSGRNYLKAFIRVNGMPHIAVDMSSGPRRGWVYHVYAANPPGPDLASVFSSHSTDGGATWVGPIPVNNDGTTTDQWMCDVSVDLSGRVWAYWWDSRNDPSNLMTETWGAVSTDGGNTFINFMVSNQNFNPNAVRIFQGTEHYYLGDYQGIAGRTVTFPCWTGQNNTLQDFVAYLPDFGILFRDDVDSINPGSTSFVRMVNPVIPSYNGQVTYTSTVSPSPAPGTFTISFIPGNVRTFNGNADSVVVQATTNASVPQNLYTIRITGTETGGPRVHFREYQIRVGNFTGIKSENSGVPKVFALNQNFPNPFNPSTSIKFTVPVASVVNLKIYDALGREVSSLLNNYALAAGNYVYDFNAAGLTSGVYFYKLTAGDFSDVKKMVLVK